jgi:hypothetical protein
MSAAGIRLVVFWLLRTLALSVGWRVDGFGLCADRACQTRSLTQSHHCPTKSLVRDPGAKCQILWCYRAHVVFLLTVTEVSSCVSCISDLFMLKYI